MSDHSILCPSAPCTEGATVIGVVNEDARVEMLEAAVPVTEALVRLARERGDLGKRLRFSFGCRQGQCAQWEDGGCSISRRAAELAPAGAGSAPLPPCPIRDRCRWFRQEGGAACQVCPEVVTDARVG